MTDLTTFRPGVTRDDGTSKAYAADELTRLAAPAMGGPYP